MISLAEQCSEFQTGAPPAGERGLCMTDHGSGEAHPQLWTGEYFADSAMGMLAAISSRYVGSQDRPWRWATADEMRAGGCTEAHIAEFCHQPKAGEWMPERLEGYGPWVALESRGMFSVNPIPDAKSGTYAIKDSRGVVYRPVCDAGKHGALNGMILSDIRFYCIKLEASQAAAPPADPRESTPGPRACAHSPGPR